MQVLRIKRVVLHHNWSGICSEGSDIALVELSEPVKGAAFPKLPPKNSILQHNTRLIGVVWGGCDGKDSYFVDDLQMSTDLTVVKGCPCPGTGTLKPLMVCLYPSSQRACKGEEWFAKVPITNQTQKKSFTVPCFYDEEKQFTMKDLAAQIIRGPLFCGIVSF